MTLLGTLTRFTGLSTPCAPSLADMIELRHQRKALTRLTDTALRDLGLTQADVEAEAKRPFWDVPCQWQR